MMLANLSPFFVATQLAKTSGVEKIYVAKNVCVCVCVFLQILHFDHENMPLPKGAPFQKTGQGANFRSSFGMRLREPNCNLRQVDDDKR